MLERGRNSLLAHLPDRIARIVKPVCWVLTGVLLGVLLTSSLRDVKAQRNTTGSRLVFIEATNNQNLSMLFVLDTKTQTCWLASGGRSGVASALAPAPAAACR